MCLHKSGHGSAFVGSSMQEASHVADKHSPVRRFIGAINGGAYSHESLWDRSIEKTQDLHKKCVAGTQIHISDVVAHCTVDNALQ